MNLSQALKWNVRNRPDKEALVCGKKRLTFKELNDRVNRMANWFVKIGLKKGDSVALMSQNCNEHAELLFACAKAGLIYVPIDFRSVSTEIAYFVEIAEPRIFFLSRDHAKEVKVVVSEMKSVERFVCLEEKLDSMAYYEDVLKGSSASEPDIDVHEDDSVSIIWTSGSGGTPKGCIHSHRTWLSGTMREVFDMSANSDDVALVFVPLYHVAGQWPLVTNLRVGARTIILRDFNPSEVLETVQREKVTTINLVPTHLLDLMQEVKKGHYDLSSIRLITFGAAPMMPGLLDEAIKVFGDVFLHFYGQSECTCAVTYMDLRGLQGTQTAKSQKRFASSCGQENIDVEARVVDADDNDVLPGEVGEIILRCDAVTKGYLKRPEETATTLRNGWLHTGDLATKDEEGYFYITDRKGFKIISGGENIYPKEVEDVLLQHPSVKETVVIGVPDKRWGEAVKAVCVLKEGCTAREHEIIEFCRGKMAGYKKPKSVDFVSELPRSGGVGKILKGKIRDKYWQEEQTPAD